jgi:hypothetical protein
MVQLKIDLQDGFTGDLVVVRINGSEVFRKEKVKTRLELSYADSFEVDVPPGQLNIEVSLADRRISKAYSLDVKAPVFLGLSVQDDTITCKKREEMFYYL